jgi:hydrogenase-4 membrane subunit HyfE
MDPFFVTILLILQVALFISALLLDLTRRNQQLVWIYTFESLVVAIILLVLGWREHSSVLFVIVGVTVLLKCIAAPVVLSRLIKKHQLTFTAPAYLNTPTTLGILLILVLAVRTSLQPLFAQIVPGEGSLLYLSVSAFFVSLFLAVNRRGAFSQIIGILAAENCLVVIAALMNIHTELWLELGILGDIFAWMLIGGTFVSIVSKHFGTTDVSRMKELAE